MCLSAGPSSYHPLLHSEIPCKVIYSKAFGNGTLYALVLSKQTAHATLDRKIVSLDGMLMRASGDSRTRFTSVSGIMDGKVKTFGVCEHMSDEHFRAIFASGTPGGGRELLVHHDVEQWNPPPVGTPVGQVGNGESVVRVSGGADGDRTYVSLEKTVVKLKSRNSTYKQMLSAAGKNVARLKLNAGILQDELTAKVLCFVL